MRMTKAVNMRHGAEVATVNMPWQIESVTIECTGMILACCVEQAYYVFWAMHGLQSII